MNTYFTIFQCSNYLNHVIIITFMKVLYSPKNLYSLKQQILLLQLTLELSQIQEVLSVYGKLLLFYTRYKFLFDELLSTTGFCPQYPYQLLPSLAGSWVIKHPSKFECLSFKTGVSVESFIKRKLYSAKKRSKSL